MNTEKKTELANSFSPVWAAILLLLAAFDSTRALKPFLIAAAAVLASAALATLLVKVLRKQIPEEAQLSAWVLSAAGFFAIAAVLLGAFFPGAYKASVKTVAAIAVLICAECASVLLKRSSPLRNGFTASAALLGAKLIVAAVLSAILIKAVTAVLNGSVLLMLFAAAAGLIAAWCVKQIFGKNEVLITLCTPVLMMAVSAVWAELPFSGFIFASEAAAALCLAGILIACGAFRRCEEKDIPRPFRSAAAAIALGIAAMACAAFF